MSKNCTQYDRVVKKKKERMTNVSESGVAITGGQCVTATWADT